MTTPTSVTPNTFDSVPDDGGSAAGFARSAIAPRVESTRPITVVLKGLIFEALVSVKLRTTETSAVGLAYATLPDGDYALAAHLARSAGVRTLNLYASSTGNKVIITLTLTGRNANDTFEGRHSSGYQDGYLAEKGNAWVPYSTRELAPKRRTATCRPTGCIVVPSNTLLTLRVLLCAFSRLPTHQIEVGVQELIDLLDFRHHDADLEIDADLEAEAGEDRDQVI